MTPSPAHRLTRAFVHGRPCLRVSLRVVKMLVMVAVVLALAFGGAGVAYRFVHDRADSLVHQVVDTQLPSRVQEHALDAGGPRPTRAGEHDPLRRRAVDTVRCHLALGSYALSIVHAFTFQRSATRIRPGLSRVGGPARPGQGHEGPLRHHGRHEVLTFVNDKGHTVLTLRARG